jgi:acyl-CoA thioester hydrolase
MISTSVLIDSVISLGLTCGVPRFGSPLSLQFPAGKADPAPSLPRRGGRDHTFTADIVWSMARAKERATLNNIATKPVRRLPPRLEDYPHRVSDIIRYGDLDPQGHVNNAVFATYFEGGRVAMFRQPDLGIGVPGATFVLARTEIDFLRELNWPGAVEVGTAVAEFGRTSFKVDQALFRDGVCAAAGRATLVLIDHATRRSRPLPDDLIARLSRWPPKGP